MIELASSMPAPQFGDESSESEDQSKFEAVPMFRCDSCKMFSRTTGDTYIPDWRTLP
jgi:hypothetical protein